jgi:serine phosphatase RsbU (regulator of sigma subunit)
VLLRREGTGLLEVPRNPALGLARSTPYEAARLELGPGDALVLCTDGLVEERRAPLDEGLDRLVRASAPLWGSSADQVCDGLVAALRPGQAADDLTVLVLRFAP